MIKSLRAFFGEHGTRYVGGLAIFLVCAYSAIVAQLPITELSDTSIPVFGLISSLENHFFDLRAKHLWQEPAQSPHLAVLAIDDESLKTIGRWPWSRTVFSAITDKLRVLGAKSVFFDVLFSEPERACAVDGKSSATAGVTDEAFAKSIKAFSAGRPFSQVNIGYSLTDDQYNALADPTSVLFTSMMNSEQAPKIEGLKFVDKNNFPIPQLIDAGAALGFINGIPDSDGVYRHAKVISSVDDVPVPSGGLALFQTYFRRSPSDIVSLRPADGLENYIVFGHGSDDPDFRKVRVDSFGQINVRFLGGRERFYHFSFHDLYEADLSRPDVLKQWKDRLAGKAVLVGSEAMGAHDLRHTPVDPDLPGLYIHANVFHMFDQNYFYKETQANINLSLLLLCIGVVLAAAFAHLRIPVLDILIVVAFSAAVIFLDRRYFLSRGYHLSLFSVCFATVSCYGWNTFHGVLREIRERRKVRNVFGHYISDKIVDAVLGNPELLKLGGERREITMLFSDIRSFSTIGEKLAPQDLALLLNIYMTKMVEVLFAFDGTLERFVGDAMVAFWSAPIEFPEHAYAAVGCAVKMLEALPALNEELTSKTLPALSIGIGLNTGQVAVGNMGSDKIFAYTAHGDAMNLTARLEGMTKFYGAGLVISEFTLKHMGEKSAEFIIRPLDKVRVKGRESPVAIYEVLPSFHPLAKDTQAFRVYCEAYALYLKRDFMGAIERLERVTAAHQDFASRQLLERSREFQLQPPPEAWAGVMEYSSK